MRLLSAPLALPRGFLQALNPPELFPRLHNDHRSLWHSVGPTAMDAPRGDCLAEQPSVTHRPQELRSDFQSDGYLHTSPSPHGCTASGRSCGSGMSCRQREVGCSSSAER